MAYTDSTLAKAQALLAASYNTSALSYGMPSTFLSMLNATPYMVPDWKVLKTSDSRVLEVPFLKRSSQSIVATTRSHNHTEGALAASGKLTPSWVPYTYKTAIALKQGDNNMYDYATQLKNELESGIAAFAEGLDTKAVEYLYTNRTTANPYARQATFNATTDVLEITESTHKARAIQISKTAMTANKVYGIGYIVYCDSVAYNLFEEQANQGSGNSTNLSFQYSGVRFVRSLYLDTLAVTDGYTKGYWVIAPEGSIAVMDWIPRQNRQGVITQVNKYGTFINPVDGLEYATHEYDTRADGTSYGGEKQDVLKQIELSIDIAFASSPITTGVIPVTSVISAFALV